MDIFVANIPFEATDVQLAELFQAHGRVDSACIIHDRQTGRSRGFGFVRMENPAQAQAAINALDRFVWKAGERVRELSVRKADPREDQGRTRRFDRSRG